MLVLTRKERQGIQIGDDITVRVSIIKGKQVRLAVEAPLNVKVHRLEVIEAIKRDGERDANTSSESSK